jgi:hypothetical protein
LPPPPLPGPTAPNPTSPVPQAPLLVPGAWRTSAVLEDGCRVPLGGGLADGIRVGGDTVFSIPIAWVRCAI